MDLPIVCIPSYQREEVLMFNTLNYLISEGYPPSKIFIFVANEEECGKYYRALTPNTYNRLIIGRRGLLEQRRFISEWLPGETIFVQMDDDVKRLKILDPNLSFLDLIRMGVDMLVRENQGLFGVLPNDDGRKMATKTTGHLTHILGSFFISVNRRELVPSIQEKEDFERSILYYNAFGKVLRYQGAGVDTKFRGTPGGLQQPGRAEREAEEIRYLCEKYPEYVKRVEKKRGEDIVLNWRTPPRAA
jgi:hypothetical protein